MRMRRSNNNGGGKFRRGPRKPNRMEGLPADEPDLPVSGAPNQPGMTPAPEPREGTKFEERF